MKEYLSRKPQINFLFLFHELQLASLTAAADAVRSTPIGFCGFIAQLQLTVLCYALCAVEMRLRMCNKKHFQIRTEHRARMWQVRLFFRGEGK